MEGNKWFEESAETGSRTKDMLPASPSSNSKGEKEAKEEEEEEEKEVVSKCERVRMEKRLTQEKEGPGDSDARGW